MRFIKMVFLRNVTLFVPFELYYRGSINFSYVVDPGDSEQ